MKLALASVNQVEQAAHLQVICIIQYGEKSNRATWWRVNFSLWLNWGMVFSLHTGTYITPIPSLQPLTLWDLSLYIK